MYHLCFGYEYDQYYTMYTRVIEGLNPLIHLTAIGTIIYRHTQCVIDIWTDILQVQHTFAI